MEQKRPVKEGDILTETCIAIGRKGDGVFKKDGFIIFANNAEMNKTYKMKITKVTATQAFAEIYK